MNCKRIQFIGLLGASYLSLTILSRLVDYPTITILGALYWPHLSGEAQTGFMVVGVFKALESGLKQVMIIGTPLLLSNANIRPFMVVPYLILQMIWLYYVWFRICRAVFNKVGLDRRIKLITSDLLLI